MGEPIRIIYPCKTKGCDLKVARTSISGLCYECSDRRYRQRQKRAMMELDKRKGSR
jgi:hypothetical protein